MSDERWKQVRDWDYEVSDRGRVRRRSKPDRIVKPRTYVRYGLVSLSGKTKILLAHRLVAEAFLGDPPSERESDVNHKDGNHANNAVENLEWTDGHANQVHAISTGLCRGRGEDHGRAVLCEREVAAIRSRYTGAYGQQTALAREFGVSQSLVSKIVRGDLWRHSDNRSGSERHVSSQPKSRLTQADADEIRRRYAGEYGQQVALAVEYGVTKKAVRDIIYGNTFRPADRTSLRKPDSWKHGRAKLNAAKVRWMRLRFERGETYTALAERYGVSRATVKNVVHRRAWRHLQ